jgi:hypothetical protein
MSGIDAFTKLCLHCDGADTSTTFTDSSPSAHTVAPNGNAQIDTAQSKFGDASALFDGTGDYLLLDGSADFAFGTVDFVVDFWLRFNALPGATLLLYDSRPSGGGAGTPYPLIGAAATTGRLIYGNNTSFINGTTTLTTGVWHHVAAVRQSGVTRLFLDGVQESTDLTDGSNFQNPASRPAIATSGSSVGTTTLNGWLEEIRVSVGTDRGWFGGFTPPAAPYSSFRPRVMVF